MQESAAAGAGQPWRPAEALARLPTNLPAALAEQLCLAPMVRAQGQPRRVRLIAGVDVGFTDGHAQAVAVLLRWPSLSVVAISRGRAPASFPYRPGFLAFRELPAIGQALAGLRQRPDLLVVDGAGQLHPRRLGLASHLGVLLDCPSIGCAKSRLCGDYREPGPLRGDREVVWLRGEPLGLVLRTKTGCRPVFVSVGHGLSLGAAGDWVMSLCTRYRLPEPTRLADSLT